MDVLTVLSIVLAGVVVCPGVGVGMVLLFAALWELADPWLRRKTVPGPGASAQEAVARVSEAYLRQVSAIGAGEDAPEESDSRRQSDD